MNSPTPPPHTLILELLRSGLIRATVRTREGRTIGYTDGDLCPAKDANRMDAEDAEYEVEEEDEAA